jgi:hypothetical protein
MTVPYMGEEVEIVVLISRELGRANRRPLQVSKVPDTRSYPASGVTLRVKLRPQSPERRGESMTPCYIGAIEYPGGCSYLPIHVELNDATSWGPRSGGEHATLQVASLTL